MTPEGLEPEIAAAGTSPEADAAPALQEPEAPPAGEHPVPWEDAGLTRLRGFFRTLGKVLFYPRDFFQNLPPEGWTEALAFGLIVGTAGILACLYWQLLFYLGLSRFLGSMSAITRLFLAGSGAMIMTMMLLTPLLVVGNLLLASLGLWLAVGLTGGPWPGFAVVWRITCYAQAALAMGFLPLLGGPVAGLWNLFLTYRGVQGAFGLSSWRALAIVCLSLGAQTLLALLLLGILGGFRLLHG